MEEAIKKTEALINQAVTAGDTATTKTLTEIRSQMGQPPGSGASSNNSGSSGRIPLSKERGVPQLLVFKGDKSAFPMFSKKLINFVGDCGLRGVMKEIANSLENRRKTIEDAKRGHAVATRHEDVSR